MVRMGSFNLCDGFHELWHEIDQCHLTYLDMEESPEKIDQRNKLEEYIQDFLCIADHHQKFCLPETNEVLLSSATTKKDFSAYKAAVGFNAIQMYAGNLIAQPWRKEYRQIKTYCGFYKHQIEANLVGAELLFEALGYRHVGNGLLVLDGSICVDRVAAVSRDCLVANVECQVLKIIWEEVSDLYKISWLDVLKFRIEHICSPEQSIKSLKYKHFQRKHQEHTRSYSQGSDPFGNSNATRCHPVPIPNSVPALVPNNSFPPLSNHHHVGLPSVEPDYMYTNGFCGNSYGNYGTNSYSYMPFNQPILKPTCNPNGYCCNPYVPPIANNYPQIVPTAKLIEVESHNNSYDLVDGKTSHKSRTAESLNGEYFKTKANIDITNNLADTGSDKKDSQLEEWDYVYRNLESQGYSKDLGERGDLLSPISQKALRESKKVKNTNLDERLNNLTVNDRPTKVNEAYNKTKTMERRKNEEIHLLDRENSSASSYDNVHAEEAIKQMKPSTSVVSSKTKTSPKERRTSVSNKSLNVQGNREDKPNKKKSTVSSPVNINKWQCKTCTFLNDGSKDICDMCFKSKIVTSEPPMEIGGAECPSCTLVNPKNMKRCQACDASLENSPTYI